MNSKIMSQRLGIGELLGLGWQLYRMNFRNIFLIILCVYLPINIIISFLPLDLLIDRYGVSSGLRLYNDMTVILDFFIGVIATLGIAWSMEKSLQQTTATWRSSLRHGASKWRSAVWTSLVQGIILIGLYLLFIVPGIIWTVYYTFWVYVVALRNLGGKPALDYSKRLVQGQWWRVLGIVLLFWILELILELLAGLPFMAMPDLQILGIVNNTLSDFIRVFFQVVMVVFFLNIDYRVNPVQIEQGVALAALNEA